MNATPLLPPVTDTRQTSAHVIAPARQVMGAIDTDPASNTAANRTVGATT
jgi:hypothetical protein